MTRPIKKARVTRRRKYYGGSKKGGGTKRKVGGRVKSFVKKQGGGPGVDPEQGNHADADALAVVGQRAMLQERQRLGERRGRRGGPEIFEDDLWNGLTLRDIIEGNNDKAQKVVTNLSLSSTPNVLNVLYHHCKILVKM